MKLIFPPPLQNIQSAIRQSWFKLSQIPYICIAKNVDHGLGISLKNPSCFAHIFHYYVIDRMHTTKISIKRSKSYEIWLNTWIVFELIKYICFWYKRSISRLF